jgi:hypothetical protein
MFSPKFVATLRSSLVALKQDRAAGPSVVALTQALQALSDEVDRLAPITLSGFQEIVISNGMAALTLKPDGAVTITGTTVSVNATRDVAIKAAGNVDIKGQGS